LRNMNKRRIITLLAAALFFFAGCMQKKPVSYQETGFTAVIVSDLHFTEKKDTLNTIVPLMSNAAECISAMMDEVTALHPDALIITGDNTNSGSDSDEKALAKILDRVKKAGIAVVMTTGNHDFNQASVQTYEKNFMPLADCHSRDEASLSHSVLRNGVLMLAMDDSSGTGGNGAAFPSQTMQWLKDQLKEADTNRWIPLFLSHHSVLSPYGSSYTISNPDLFQTLEQGGVRLCFTGHQHGQAHLEKGNMQEIISAMPLNGAHLYGVLKINDAGMHYQTHSFDFRTYATEDLYRIISDADETAAAHTRETFEKLLDERGCTGEAQAQAVEMVTRMFSAMARGTLGSEADEIRNMPMYEETLRLLADTNYGPWMKSLMEHPADADHLEIEF